VAYGVVERFLLYGDFDDDVFATGGDVEVRLEPRTLYDDVKIYPLAKLDRSAALYQIKKCIDEEEGRYVCMYVCLCACVCVYVCLYACLSLGVCVCVCMYVCLYACLCVCMLL